MRRAPACQLFGCAWNVAAAARICAAADSVPSLTCLLCVFFDSERMHGLILLSFDRERANKRPVYPGLKFFRDGKQVSFSPADIPGVMEAGYRPLLPQLATVSKTGEVKDGECDGHAAVPDASEEEASLQHRLGEPYPYCFAEVAYHVQVLL